MKGMLWVMTTLILLFIIYRLFKANSSKAAADATVVVPDISTPTYAEIQEMARAAEPVVTVVQPEITERTPSQERTDPVTTPWWDEKIKTATEPAAARKISRKHDHNTQRLMDLDGGLF